MSPYDDDDDWVGTPPEGRHSADRANSAFWSQPPLAYTLVFFGLFVLAIVVLVLAL
jgi:hypothetical protein